jgi:putative DNA primase/helicase
VGAVEDGQRLRESLLKDLTGSDTITARFLRREFFDFKP